MEDDVIHQIGIRWGKRFKDVWLENFKEVHHGRDAAVDRILSRLRNNAFLRVVCKTHKAEKHFPKCSVPFYPSIAFSVEGFPGSGKSSFCCSLASSFPLYKFTPVTSALPSAVLFNISGSLENGFLPSHVRVPSLFHVVIDMEYFVGTHLGGSISAQQDSFQNHLFSTVVDNGGLCETDAGELMHEVSLSAASISAVCKSLKNALHDQHRALVNALAYDASFEGILRSVMRAGQQLDRLFCHTMKVASKVMQDDSLIQPSVHRCGTEEYFALYIAGGGGMVFLTVENINALGGHQRLSASDDAYPGFEAQNDASDGEISDLVGKLCESSENSSTKGHFWGDPRETAFLRDVRLNPAAVATHLLQKALLHWTTQRLPVAVLGTVPLLSSTGLLENKTGKGSSHLMANNLSATAKLPPQLKGANLFECRVRLPFPLSHQERSVLFQELLNGVLERTFAKTTASVGGGHATNCNMSSEHGYSTRDSANAVGVSAQYSGLIPVCNTRGSTEHSGVCEGFEGGKFGSKNSIKNDALGCLVTTLVELTTAYQPCDIAALVHGAVRQFWMLESIQPRGQSGIPLPADDGPQIRSLCLNQHLDILKQCFITAFTQTVPVTARLAGMSVTEYIAPSFSWSQLPCLATPQGGPAMQNVWDTIMRCIVTPFIALRRKSLKSNSPIGWSVPLVILKGDTGTGKTFIAKTLGSLCNVPTYVVQHSDILRALVGESENRLRQIFSLAKFASPSLLIFEQVEALAPPLSETTRVSPVVARLTAELLRNLDSLRLQASDRVQDGFLYPVLVVLTTAGRRQSTMDNEDAVDLDPRLYASHRLPLMIQLPPLSDWGPQSLVQLFFHLLPISRFSSCNVVGCSMTSLKDSIENILLAAFSRGSPLASLFKGPAGVQKLCDAVAQAAVRRQVVLRETETQKRSSDQVEHWCNTEGLCLCDVRAAFSLFQAD